MTLFTYLQIYLRNSNTNAENIDKKKMWRNFCILFPLSHPSALNFVAKIKSDKNFVPISFLLFLVAFLFAVLMTKK